MHGGRGFGAGREAAPWALVQLRSGAEDWTARNRSEPGGHSGWLPSAAVLGLAPKPSPPSTFSSSARPEVPAHPLRARLSTSKGWTSIFSLPGMTLSTASHLAAVPHEGDALSSEQPAAMQAAIQCPQNHLKPDQQPLTTPGTTSASVRGRPHTPHPTRPPTRAQAWLLTTCLPQEGAGGVSLPLEMCLLKGCFAYHYQLFLDLLCDLHVN